MIRLREWRIHPDFPDTIVTPANGVVAKFIMPSEAEAVIAIINLLKEEKPDLKEILKWI